MESRLTTPRRARSAGSLVEVADVVEHLIAGLSDARRILAAEEPEERKALVGMFLGGIRIESGLGRAVLRWYRVPQSPWVRLVAVGGIEPPTRGL
jgi:hypothetical protein